MKFNIVLIPNDNEVSNTLIDLANTISIKNNLNPDYLIIDIEQKSIPHASVIQFELGENPSSRIFLGKNNKDFLSLIWRHTSETWQEILADNKNIQELTCVLGKKINYKHDVTGLFAGVTWAEIIINKNENLFIQRFHDTLREKLTPLGIKCLNASSERYNPHFTLFNIHTALLEKTHLIREIPESYIKALKFFSLRPVLGIANNNWELTAKIYEEISPKLNREKIRSHL